MYKKIKMGLGICFACIGLALVTAGANATGYNVTATPDVQTHLSVLALPTNKPNQVFLIKALQNDIAPVVTFADEQPSVQAVTSEHDHGTVQASAVMQNQNFERHVLAYQSPDWDLDHELKAPLNVAVMQNFNFESMPLT